MGKFISIKWQIFYKLSNFPKLSNILKCSIYVYTGNMKGVLIFENDPVKRFKMVIA